MNNTYINKKEFGDYQTPIILAEEVCKKIRDLGVIPNVIIEPTCGVGNFLHASLKEFKNCNKIIGIEINDNYFNVAKQRLKNINKIELINENFFNLDWFKILNEIEVPILFIGNLPWVTNSEIGLLEGNNLPNKTNFQKVVGFNAMTGQSNFDISEWMLIKIINLSKFMQNNDIFIAFLIKTSVARKILNYMQQNNFSCSNINIFHIDAKKEFNVSVDACLFTCNLGIKSDVLECNVFENLNSLTSLNTLGFINNGLLNNIKMAKKTSYLYSANQKIWRSGVKHDCSKVMEFRLKGKELYNGFNEKIEIEETFLFPLLKSSDIANDRIDIQRMVLVPQTVIGEETTKIKDIAPQTWVYLCKYKDLLDKRKSIIYKGKPSFSIFGVGEYSFLPWKIAISGLYKKLNFKLIEPHKNKPVMFDDTVYFLAFKSKEKAEEVYNLLNTGEAKDFLISHIFWDSKRPITTAILNKLDINKLKLIPDDLSLPLEIKKSNYALSL